MEISENALAIGHPDRWQANSLDTQNPDSAYNNATVKLFIIYLLY
jgi:hypothetical protein